MKRNRFKTFLFLSCAGLLAVVTSASILHTAMLLFVRSVGESKVPPVVGLEISDAREEIAGADFSTVIEREVHTAEYGEGRVVSQRPVGGRTLRKGRKVLLTVSLGVRESELPQVAGLSLRQAGLALQDGGFAEGGVRRIAHDSIEKGTIIAQDPPGGALGTEGGTVDLLISTGPVSRFAPLPDITGLSVEDAESLLRRRGFTMGARWTRPEPSVRPLTVLDQFPPPGSPVPRGQAVGVTVSIEDEGNS